MCKTEGEANKGLLMSKDNVNLLVIPSELYYFVKGFQDTFTWVETRKVHENRLNSKKT